MARFTLEWRQLENGPDGAWFAHRLAHAQDARQAREVAGNVGDGAWGREFRLSRGGRDVFTDLARMLAWNAAASALPDEAPRHIWRDDHGRDLVADTFLVSVTEAAAAAVAADVLLHADADALLRFALGSLRRPRR